MAVMIQANERLVAVVSLSFGVGETNCSQDDHRKVWTLKISLRFLIWLKNLQKFMSTLLIDSYTMELEMGFTGDLSWQHCAEVFVHVRLFRLHQASALPILQRVWMRNILQQDEGVFFDSHLDVSDALVWIGPALRSTKRKRSIKQQ